MRVRIDFVLPLAALLLAIVLTPSSAWAATATKNCPTEPAQNVPIVSGETYWGTNCVLSTTGDVDSFAFTAAAGDTWSMTMGFGASTSASDLCLALFAPGSTGTSIFSGCTFGGGGKLAVATTQKLATAGTYTIVVSDLVDGTSAYALSLERINPAPPDATALTLSKNVASEVNPPTAQDAYTFYGATTGTYEITTSITAGPSDVCFNIYQSGVSVLSGGPLCTFGGGGRTTITSKLTPTLNGTFVVVIYAATNDGNTSYNLELSCLLGNCGNPPPTYPACTLKDTATYSATTSTLTMDFTVGNKAAATWNAWLTEQNTMISLFSLAQPITSPPGAPVAITKTYTSLSKEGKVGVLSTLTTPTGGIICSNWEQVSTGTP